VEPTTFEFCARTYIAAQAPGWKSGKHAKQWLATLERYAFPVIGPLDVMNVTTSHVLQILQAIWSTKTETATRVRGRIESILGLGRASRVSRRQEPGELGRQSGTRAPLPDQAQKAEKAPSPGPAVPEDRRLHG